MVMPYLNFTGDCEEAFLLYQRAFNGQPPLLARYPDSDKIMHGHVMLTETGGVSGADATWSVEKGSAVSIHVYCATEQQAQKAFDVLAEEGRVGSPIAKNPPPHDDGVSGQVVDKFGFTWVVSAQLG